MKLGLSYNLFDGEELLKSSILSVRDNCDHISVVYQTISSFGNKCSENLEDLLSDLKKEKLIDQLHFYPTDLSLKPGKNELIKRNIGLKLARKSKCSHFLTIDSDEYYEKEQFKNAKIFIEKNKIETSACKFIGYIKEPIYQMQEESFYYVPFISKIKFFSKFDPKNPFPVLTDPTRKLKGKNCKIFDSKDLLMHHMSYVRKDLNKKFNNSSAREIFIKSDVAKKIANYQYPGDWIDPTVHFVDPKANNVFKVKEVPNVFNVSF